MPMSTPSWQKQLRQITAPLTKTDAGLRIAVLGVGNVLNGDDAAGVRAARALLRCQARSLISSSILVIEAGLAPENFSGRLRQFGAQRVILIDAARMEAPAGEIRWLPWEQSASLSASTHTLPLSMFAAYLVSELGCQVDLLGIQVVQTGPGQPVSPPVQNALRRLLRGFQNILA
jgi:hydrogenase 3 maturation protease